MGGRGLGAGPQEPKRLVQNEAAAMPVPRLQVSPMGPWRRARMRPPVTEELGLRGGPGIGLQHHHVCPCSSWSGLSHGATEQTTMPSLHLRGWQDPTNGPCRLTLRLPRRKCSV